MLLVLIFLCLLQPFIKADAAPLFEIFSRQTINFSLPQECICSDTRSRWDIVWSCLVTIFACSWVSVHPNISGPGKRRWKRALRRLDLMFWSIISPELIIFWAARQWVAARDLAEKYSEYGWTKTHGYFIQMGGFLLYDGDKAVGVLGPEKLWNLLSGKKIIMPTVTEEEINDRSKSDGLSKAIVIVQTTWFIAQCVARRAEGLIITELELVTLAFAALNTIMYAFWWNKPLDVQTVVPVYLLPSPPSTKRIEEEHEENADLSDRANSDVLRNPEDYMVNLENPIPPSKSTISVGHNLQDAACKVWRTLSNNLFCWPHAMARMKTIFLIRRVIEILDSSTIGEGKMRVNTFYANSSKPLNYVALVFSLPLVGILFGAIHCAGWYFPFPSFIEANIWRVSSVVITGVPAIWLLYAFLGTLADRYRRCRFCSFLSTARDIADVLAAVVTPFYVLARLALLTEALILLRDLPPSALAVVEWTSFLPHV